MKKKNYVKFRSIDDLPKNAKIWSKQIYQIMITRNWTQEKIAKEGKVPISTISAWLGKGRNPENTVEPKIEKFSEFAKNINTTVDFLMGNDECFDKSKEAIHRQTLLSRVAINKLVECKEYLDKTEDDIGYFLIKECIDVINFLIANIEILQNNEKIDLTKSSLDERNGRNILNNIYAYLFGNFDTDCKPNGYMYSETKRNKKGKMLKCGHLLSSTDVKSMYEINIMNNLAQLRKKAFIYEKEDNLS